MEFNFNVTGADRKRLAGAISEILGEPVNYLGAPTFAYEVGKYHIDKNGLVTGEYAPELLAELAERGFAPEFQAEKFQKPDRLVIEYPLDDFSPEAIERLNKMVLSKEVLLKKALGTDDLLIEILEDRCAFPWFSADADSNTISAYAHFIAALCKTAKEKKRVNAKAQEAFENEKFAMRIWLISLGMVGAEFGTARKLLMKNLSGNSGWRYGKPEKAETVTGESVSEEVADHE